MSNDLSPIQQEILAAADDVAIGPLDRVTIAAMEAHGLLCTFPWSVEEFDPDEDLDEETAERLSHR